MLVLSLVFVCIFGGMPVADVNAVVLHDERKDYEDEQEISEAYRNTANQLVEEIQKVNDEMADQTKLIEAAQKEVESVDAEIAEEEANIEDVEAEIEKKRAELSLFLSIMYESSVNDDSISVMLESTDMLSYLNREEYVGKVTKYVNKGISDLEAIENERYDRLEELKLMQEDREDKVAILEAEREEMGVLVEELGTIMKEAEKKADDAEELAEALRQKVLELEAQERALLERRTYSGENSSSINNIIYDGDGTDYYYVSAYPYTDQDLDMLAAIIQCEAGSVSYPGMIAVGSVVMNRVESPNFANTIEGVIYAPYQFEPVSNGIFAVTMAQGAADSCYMAAQEVLEGKRNVPNFYFKAAWYAEANGISGVNIGGNVFH